MATTKTYQVMTEEGAYGFRETSLSAAKVLSHFANAPAWVVDAATGEVLHQNYVDDVVAPCYDEFEAAQP